MTRRCTHCRKEFLATAAKRVFCSAACRLKVWRERQAKQIKPRKGRV